MCGIAGEVIFRGSRRICPADLFPMIGVLAHRGPESAGYWTDERGQVLLMHARLSLVDLAGGAQPMANEDGRLWVSMNGEIYGHRAHRRALLERGHRLRTACDAEVVPHLFEEKGEDCLKDLRGEFAISLWDERERALYLVRDRFGVKPLFYTVTEDSVVFGSEAKAVLCHPRIETRLDRTYLVQSLLSLALPEQCCFEGVRQVRPGHVLRITADGIDERPYWTWAATNPDVPSMDEAGERFRELFDEAVRLRLDADVEIGAYLSGGLDSSTVVESMARQAPYRVKAFTIRFSEYADDEAYAAADTARRLGVESILVDASGKALAESFLPTVWHGEHWVPNSHGAAKYLLSREARNHVKAVLTGEGADELLTGYAFFVHQHLLERHRAGLIDDRQIKAFLRACPSSQGEPVPVVDYRKHSMVTGIYGTYPYGALRAAAVTNRLKLFLDPAFAADVDLEKAMTRHAASLPGETLADMPAVAASRLAWTKCDLPNYILTSMGDRPEMANSIEGRLPFLDPRLADFVLSLPMKLLSDTTNGKLVLRHAMRKLLPATTTQQSKSVFWTPRRNEAGMLRTELFRHYLSRDVTREVGLFHPGRLAWASKRAFVPLGGRFGSSMLALLTTAATVHMLHDLFVKDLPSSAERFAAGHSRWRWNCLLERGPATCH